MKFKFFFSFIFLAVIFSDVSAQTWKWYMKAEIPTIIYSNLKERLCTDSEGNRYISGTFKDSITISGITLHENSQVNCSGYIFKFDSSGMVIWYKKFESTELFQEYDLAVSPNGTCYVCGDAKGNMVIDGNTFSSLSQGAILCKINPNGICSWIKSFPTSMTTYQPSGHCSDIVLDSNENIYASGFLYSDTIGSTDHYGSFLFKIDSSGNNIWEKRYKMHFDNTTFGYCTGCFDMFHISLDNYGHIYVSGFSALDTSTQFGIIESDTMYGDKSFISSYEVNGNFRWTKHFDYESIDWIENLRNGNLIAKTHFVDSIQIAGITYNSFGSTDGAIFYLDSLGNNYGGLVIQCTGTDWISEFGIDTSENILVFGAYSDSLNFNGQFLKYDISTFNNFYLFSINPNDNNLNWNFEWIGNQNEYPSSIWIDNHNNIFLTGEFRSDSCDFGTLTAYNNGHHSRFWAELKYPITYSSQAFSACGNYISPSGNYTWTTSGIYYDTIPNTSGCDSIITINLIINSIDTSLTQTGVTLTANATTATYQWLNCDNGFAIINGATNQTFTATANGNYAVAITQNGCTDTSACYNVAGVGVSELAVGNMQLAVFPNPAGSQLTVQLLRQAQHDHYTISITDILGREIYQSTNNLNSEIINLKSFSSGIYFLKVISADGNSAVRKFVKE